MDAEEFANHPRRTTFAALRPGAKFIAFNDDPPHDDGEPLTPVGEGKTRFSSSTELFLKLSEPEQWTIEIQPDPRCHPEEDVTRYPNAVRMRNGARSHFGPAQDVMEVLA